MATKDVFAPLLEDEFSPIQDFANIEEDLLNPVGGDWAISKLASGDLNLMTGNGAVTINQKLKMLDPISIGNIAWNTADISQTFNGVQNINVASLRSSPIYNQLSSLGAFANASSNFIGRTRNSAGLAYNVTTESAMFCSSAKNGGGNTFNQIAAVFQIIGGAGTFSSGNTVSLQTLAAGSSSYAIMRGIHNQGPRLFSGGSITTGIAQENVGATGASTANWNTVLTGAAPNYISGSVSFGHSAVPAYNLDIIGSARLQSSNRLILGGAAFSINRAHLYGISLGRIRFQGNTSSNTDGDFLDMAFGIAGTGNILNLNTSGSRVVFDKPLEYDGKFDSGKMASLAM